MRPGPSRRTLLAATALACLGPVAGIGSAIAEMLNPPNEVTKRGVRAFIDRIMSEGNTPGVSCAVVLPDGTIIAEAGGVADLDTKGPMTSATRLQGGSTGKSFCATAVMSLVTDGKLQLDTPIAPIFADEPWYQRLPNAKDLTLRILLMHEAGFPQFLDLISFQGSFLLDSLAGRDTGYSPRRMLSFILDTPPLCPAGREHHYSDLGYDLIGLVIEKTTGTPYYDVLTERVLTPLGLPDVVPADHPDIPGLATGYARGGLLEALAGVTGRSTKPDGTLRKNPALEFAGGGLATTPRALALFFWKLAQGQIVPQAAFDEMIRAPINLETNSPDVHSAYGLGLFVNERKQFGRYISHSGFYPGYVSNVAYFLDRKIGVALQFNTDHGPDVHTTLRELARSAFASDERGPIDKQGM